MRPAYVGHPVYAAFIFGTLGLWAIVEVRQALRRRNDATEKDRGSLAVLRATGLFAALLAATLLRVKAAAFPYGAASLTVSLVLMWAGIALRGWCFHTLGTYFTFMVMTSAEQRIITTGPYGVLRHPSYAAIMLILAGLGLTYGNWLSFAALTIVPLLGFVNRIRVEEAALSTAVGDSYTEYARTRKRIIPFVW